MIVVEEIARADAAAAWNLMLGHLRSVGGSGRPTRRATSVLGNRSRPSYSKGFALGGNK
jgi:hypothetical protein